MLQSNGVSREIKSPVALGLWGAAWALVTALACVALSGCGVQDLAQGKLEAPKVSLKGVNLQKPTKQGWPLMAILEVHNPNPLDISLLGYDYEVWVEGRSVARGESKKAVTLPARGETLVEVPVLLKLKVIPEILPRLLQDEKFTYEIAGGLRLPQTLGFRAPFRFKGETRAREGLERLRPLIEKHF